MKVIVKNSLLTLLCVVTVFFASCRKDDVEEIIPHPPIEGDEFTIIKTGANDTIYSDMQPRVVFNYKQGETYELGDTGLEYRFVLGSFKVSYAHSLHPIEGKVVWNQSFDTAFFSIDKQPIYSGDRLKIEVSAYWEVLINGEWSRVREGSEYQVEKKDIEFFVTNRPGIVKKIGFDIEQSSYSIFSSPQIQYNVDLLNNYAGFRPRIELSTVADNEENLIEAEIIHNGDNSSQIVFANPLPRDKQIYITVDAFWEKFEDGAWVTSTQGKYKFNFKTASTTAGIVATLPHQNESDVSVFSQALVDFNIKLDTVFRDNKLYLPKVKHAKIVYDDNVEVNGFHFLDATKKQLIFRPYDNLPEEKDVQLQVTIEWRKLSEESWTSVGEEYEEHFSVPFQTTTFANSDLVPRSYYSYSYPIHLQRNFLKDEHSEGYIKLSDIEPMWEDHILGASPEDLFVRFYDGTEGIETPLSYNSSAKQFDFAIPPTLQNNTIYRMELISTKNVSETILSKIYFKTSLFNTFMEKIEVLDVDEEWTFPVGTTGYYELRELMYNEEELFDMYEVSDLMKFEAILENVPYYEEDIYPIMYKLIDDGELTLKWRNEKEYGRVPLRAIHFEQHAWSLVLKPSEISTFQPSLTGTTGLLVIYNVNSIMYEDYYDLIYQVHSIPKPSRSETMNALIDTDDFPKLRAGDYHYKIKYKLPGKNQYTSEKELSIYFDGAD